MNLIDNHNHNKIHDTTSNNYNTNGNTASNVLLTVTIIQKNMNAVGKQKPGHEIQLIIIFSTLIRLFIIIIIRLIIMIKLMMRKLTILIIIITMLVQMNKYCR